jgi:uncharacterized membrane protein
MLPLKQLQASNRVVGIGIILVGFAVPHFVDDFLYDIPAEFGLTNPQVQVMGGVFFAALVLALVLSARGRRAGYYATLAFGLVLVLAAVLRHLQGILAPEPYWGGFVSEWSILGLIASGLALMAASIQALRLARSGESQAERDI